MSVWKKYTYFTAEDNNSFIIDWEMGERFPIDEENEHYKEYSKWLDRGNIPQFININRESL